MSYLGEPPFDPLAIDHEGSVPSIRLPQDDFEEARRTGRTIALARPAELLASNVPLDVALPPAAGEKDST